MKKTWNNIKIEEVTVSSTAYDPNGGVTEDGSYNSYDGLFDIPTYGPSSNASNGTPIVDVH